MDYSEKVCKKIRFERIRHKFAQAEFAVEIGMSTYHYGEIERGRVNIKIDTLYRISRGLNMQPYELLQFDDMKM